MPHRWTRRQALYFLSGVAGATALNACAPSPESASSSAPTTTSTTTEPTSAAVAIVTWIGYTPLYIAQEKGFYRDFGLNLDLRVFNSGAEAIAAFGSGRVNGLSLVPSEAVTVAASGKDYRVIYVVDTSNGGDGVLARNSINDIAAFRGKQIAVETSGVSHFFLLQVLEDAGLTESDVTLVNLSPDAAAAAYQAGRVDIAVTYAPFLFTANDAQKDGRIIFDSSKLKIPTAIADLIIFDTETINSNPKAIEAFVRGNAKALEFLESNRSEGLAIAAQQLGLTPDELDEQLEGVKLATLDDNINMLNNPDSNLYLMKPLTDLVKFLQSQQQISQAPDLSNVLDPQFVLAAKQPS